MRSVKDMFVGLILVEMVRGDGKKGIDFWNESNVWI
jgi:hypothetical protein